MPPSVQRADTSLSMLAKKLSSHVAVDQQDCVILSSFYAESDMPLSSSALRGSVVAWKYINLHVE